MINYSLSAKNEITSVTEKDDGERLAFLSAFLHTSASLFFSNEGLRMEITTDTEIVRFKIASLIKYFLDETPLVNSNKLLLDGENAKDVLFACRIFGVVDDQIEIVSGIADTLIESVEEKSAYLRGAFLGAGCVSLKKGYHLEFALSNSDIANDLGAILDEFDIKSKITTHNGKYVLYVKEAESVSDCLALMGASQAVIALNNEIVLRDIRKQTNRVNNCDMANLNKSVNASVAQIQAIELIDKILGIGSLNPKLKVVAQARLDNPDYTYSDLANALSLAKSTLKNRLNKLMEIASSLNKNDKD